MTQSRFYVIASQPKAGVAISIASIRLWQQTPMQAFFTIVPASDVQFSGINPFSQVKIPSLPPAQRDLQNVVDLPGLFEYYGIR